jgi:conjugative transfer region lipoprotein (TIGR03751 family)
MNKKIIIITAALISLTGCTAGFVKPKKGSPTMAQSYELAAKGKNKFYGGKANRYAPNFELPQLKNYQGKSAKFASVLDSQFPKLPNPQNLMYIFGHYADNGEIPVPGHFITFSMYEKDHYALSDEIQKPYNDGQFTR